MKTRHFLTSTLLALLWWTSSVWAEDIRPPLYQVEVIVFETTAQRGWTEEYWPWPDTLKEAMEGQKTQIAGENMENAGENADAENPTSEISGRPPLNDAGASDVTLSLPNSTLIPLQPPAEPEESHLSLTDILNGLPPDNAPAWIKEIKAVSPQDFLLADAVKKLTPTHGYRILTHLAWTQPAISKQQAQPLSIDAETPQGDLLNGTLMFYKNRFTHIQVDLKLDRMIPQTLRETFAQHEAVPLEMLPESWPFYLKASRKIKSGPWYYIDHPLFGVLVTIKKISQ